MQKRFIAGMGGILLAGLLSLPLLRSPGKEVRSVDTSVSDGSTYASGLNALADDKKALRALAVQLGINYSSRYPEASRNDVSFFMFNQVSALANRRGVEVLAFSPAKRETKGVCTRISFLGEILATYADMVIFFQDLEERERLLIDSLEVTSRSQTAVKHQAKFTVSYLEITDPLLGDLWKDEVTPMPASDDRLVSSAVGRDPFSIPLQAFQSGVGEPPTSADLVDISGELHLTGIVTSPIPETAIIERRLLRKGDEIDEKKIIEIKRGQVVLEKDKQRYLLKLKEATPRKKINIHPVEVQ